MTKKKKTPTTAATAKQTKRSAPAPNATAPLGQGGRFAALSKKLGKRSGVKNPAALSAFIGRRKFGAKKFASLGKKG